MVTRSVPVIASCVDSNLVECRLRFGKTTSPQTRTQLRHPIRTQFERERLADWDTSNLNGVYTVALTAVNAAGNRVTTTVPLIIDNTPPLTVAGSGNTIPLIDYNAEVSFRTPAWSPDGKRIAFASNEGGAADIWLLSLTDNSRRRLTRDIAIDLNPAWHPDSERLIFQSRHAVEIGVSETHMNTGSRVNWEIWTIRLDGGDHRLLIRAYDLQPGLSSATTRERSSHPSHGAGLVTPAWSPRGEQNAFAADVDGDFEIWVARNALAVFSGAELQAVQLTRNTHQDVYPAWAPDTSQIAFQTKRNGDWNIGIMEFDGSREKLLHQSFANETRPVWSPNEKSMLFNSDQGRDLQSPFVHNLQDGQITQISPISSAGQSLPLGQFIESADWSPDGKAIVFQSNDALYFMPLEFPELPIEARLERPVDGDQVYGKVNLIGIARGELFREYRLEYASTSSLNEWHRIGRTSTVPVTPEPFDIENANPLVGKFLVQWDARNLRGAYVLRLVAVTTNGDEFEDRNKAFVENEYPRLEILYPLEGLSDRFITVRGRTDQQSTVTLNNAAVYLDEEGRFESQLLLREGENRIEIKAANSIGLETRVYRSAVWGDDRPEIVVESPQEFAILNVPYVTISEHTNTAEVQLKINGVAIPLQPDRRFSRTLSLQAEGSDHIGDEANLIRVEAVNRIGRGAEILRRVIYQPQLDVRNDANPTGIAEIFPPNGADLAQPHTNITAVLVDDSEIAPSTIQFSFDEQEYVFDGTKDAAIFDGNSFDFNPETGRFTHIPPNELVDGLHTFKLVVQDTQGNSTENFDFEFFIDTQPFNAAISANRTEDVLKVFVETNKRLAVIPSAEILPSSSLLGYSRNLNSSDRNELGTAPVEINDVRLFRYESEFRIAPSQNGFSLSATVQPSQYGRDIHAKNIQIPLVGYFTDRNRLSGLASTRLPQYILEQLPLHALYRLYIESGPEVVLFQHNMAPNLKMTLRSQSGSNQNLVSAQNHNAMQRRLSILPAVYIIEANYEEWDSLLWFNSPYPRPSPVLDSSHVALTTIDSQPNGFEEGENTGDMVLFWWNPRDESWIPIDTTTNEFGTLEAVGHRFGSYALMTEKDAQIIHSIRPGDGDEVPLSPYFVEGVITDGGSGVDSIEMRVDGRPVQIHFERNTDRLSYIPSELNAGEHTLELKAIDRAKNSVYHRQTFFTSDIFDFVDVVTFYTNPAKYEVKIGFNLTKSAHVTLKIHDAAGRLVHTVEWQDVTGKPSGSNTGKFYWNCQNQAGESADSGVYFFILEATRGEQSVSRSGKFSVVR